MEPDGGKVRSLDMPGTQIARNRSGARKRPRVDDRDLARLRMVLGRLGRVIRQQSDDDLTHTQISLLFNIRRMQPVTAGDVAVAEGVTPPSITRSLSRLTERGLIVRRTHDDDGRVAVLSLTPEGEAECRRALRKRDEWLHDRLMELTQEEVDHLLEAVPLLERLCLPSLNGDSGVEPWGVPSEASSGEGSTGQLREPAPVAES